MTTPVVVGARAGSTTGAGPGRAVATRAATPRSVRRLRRLQVAAVGLILAFGALVTTALTAAYGTGSLAMADLAQYHRLTDARVQALAVQQSANAWALDPTPSAHDTMLSQLDALATTVADASAIAEDREQIAPLSGALVQYGMKLQDALNAQGVEAATILDGANDQLTKTLITPLEQATKVVGDRFDLELRTSMLPWVIGGALVAGGGLIWVLVALARSSHRYLNLGVVTGLVCVLAALGLVAAAASSASSAANAAASGRADLETLSAGRQALNQARSDELLSVGLRQSGGAKEQAWTTAFEAARASTSVDLSAARSLRSALNTYAAAHRDVTTAAKNGDWSSAQKIVLGNGSSATAFDNANRAAATMLANLRAPVIGNLSALVTATGGLIIAGVLITLVGAAAALLGVARRIQEYR